MGMNYHPSSVSPEPNAHRGNWLDIFYTELKKELAKDEEPQTNLLDNSEDRVDDVSDMNGQEFFPRSILEGVYDPSYASHSPIAKPNVVMHDDGTDFPEPKNDSLLGEVPSEEQAHEMDNEERADYDYVPDSMFAKINESMTKAEKDKLPDSMFGLPKQRKYPLHDETHVRAAISMFHHCNDPEDRKTLAHNICRRIKELNLDIKFKKDSPIYPYAPKDLRLDESVCGFYGLNAMLEIPLDEAADWADGTQAIINEGETAVADDGTGADSDPSLEDPWYKRLDINGDFPKNLLRNRENGPASSKQSKNIDYDKYQSELG